MRNFLAGIAVVIGAQILGQAVGCASTPGPKDPTTELIDRCTVEARAARQTGSSISEAMRVFDNCMLEGGAPDAAR